MLSEELAALLPRFVQNVRGVSYGPSREAILKLCERCHLPQPTEQGKEKLVREVLSSALDNDLEGGQRFVELFLKQVKASGGLDPTSDSYAGEETISRVRTALSREGWDLMSDGTVLPLVLEHMEGREMTDALRIYVRRARRAAADDEVLIGTSKCLEEAVARHVLVEVGAGYEHLRDIVSLFYHAFDRLGLAQPAANAPLDPDPYRDLQISVQLVARAVARLRNDRGDGHGRPAVSTATGLESSLCSLASALVSELLLGELELQFPGSASAAQPQRP